MSGKTTHAMNLAWEAAQDFRVLLWDLDPQGAADTSYRDVDLTLDHTMKPAGRQKRLLETVADDDVVFLDCPPGAGLVAENAVHAADLMVAPLVPSPLSLRSFEQVPSTVTIEKMGPDRAPVGSFAPHTEAAHAYSELWVRTQSTIKARQRKRRR